MELHQNRVSSENVKVSQKRDGCTPTLIKSARGV